MIIFLGADSSTVEGVDVESSLQLTYRFVSIPLTRLSRHELPVLLYKISVHRTLAVLVLFIVLRSVHTSKASVLLRVR
jgi:hypothetical protein